MFSCGLAAGGREARCGEEPFFGRRPIRVIRRIRSGTIGQGGFITRDGVGVGDGRSVGAVVVLREEVSRVVLEEAQAQV